MQSEETFKRGSKIDETLKCKGCGALVHFQPGTNSLKCDYCGVANEISGGGTERSIISNDFDQFVNSIDSTQQGPDLKAVVCTSCGSRTMLDFFVTSDECPFCTAALVLDMEGNKQYVKPHYILPFGVTKEQGIQFFRNWLKGLWWTPNDLAKKVTGSASQLRGVYLPHWSFNTYAVTRYSGERGDYYYTTETYTETVNGKTETRTRQVRHTRWSYASGLVNRHFKDLLVAATESLPKDTLIKLGPWRFENLVKFDGRYLSGFRSETYQVDAEQGFNIAARETEAIINSDVRDDIGGDEQRINHTDTDYRDKEIKYLMLPVWVSAYSYKDKIYQFTINASTGEVIGERPLSWVKITMAILFVLLLIAAAVIYFRYYYQPSQ